MRLDKAEYLSDGEINIYAQVIDAEGNSNFPLTRDNMEVKIDGEAANIEDIIVQPNGEYLVRVKAPTDPGEHSIWMQVVTSQGSASDSQSFRVSGEIPTGTVSVSLNGSVDDATQNWEYPTHYKAPVFRRGMDNPTFILTLDDQIPTGYEALFEIYDANNQLIAKHHSTNSPNPNEFDCLWKWDDDVFGFSLVPSSLPIGIYRVNASLVNINDPIDKHNIGSDEFYVIFEFDENQESFVTWDTEPGYWSGGVNDRHDHSLHIYDHREILKNAIEWANGAVTTEDAVDDISELARRIDGQMVYHHALTDETWVFRLDEYDNDFDTQPDEADENWNYNYEPYTDGRSGLGRAYNTSDVTCRLSVFGRCIIKNYDRAWVDGSGNTYTDRSRADRIAWYLDTVEMLKEDFDPEDRIPDPEGPTASEPHQHSLGVCDDYAMVAVGYLRAIGVPSRLATGWFDSDGHTWVQWNNVTGDEKWHHLDVDYGYKHSEWEAEDSWKYNRLYYHTDDGITWDHIWVRDSEDVNDVIDIAGGYNRLTHRSMAYSTTRSEIICNYKILGVPTFKPGKETTISINITNPTSESKTINVTVLLISSYLPPGGTPSPLTGATKQVTIPANSEMIEEMNITVPGDASSGDYNLEIYEEENLALQQATQVLAEYEVTTEMPDEIVYEQPFTFSTTIKNNATAPIHNISVELDTHYYFNTTDPLKKEIAILNTGESHTFTWSLTPIWYGDLRIDVGTSTSDAGSETKMVTIPVLQTPELHITPQVPEKVEKGDDFFLKATVSNSGDIPSDPVILEITTPENVTANRTSVDLGTIGAQENKTCTFRISQDESNDFMILLTATSASATAENYAFINIAQSNMWIDILKEDETPGIEHHTSVIETLYGEPCNLTIYVSNTGDGKLSNVQILTNVGVTKYVGDISEGEARQVSIVFTPTTLGLSGLNVTVRSGEIEKEITRTLLVEKFDFAVYIPKTRYDLNEPVPIDITITNEVPNMRFVDLKIEINISGSNYNQVFDIPLLSLAPLETKNTVFTWDTTGVNDGTYIIVTSLMMADREVMSDEKYIQFTVRCNSDARLNPQLIGYLILATISHRRRFCNDNRDCAQHR